MINGSGAARSRMAVALLSLGLGLQPIGCNKPLRLTYGGLESRAMGEPMEYAVFLPQDWTPAEQLPLVIFLHGGGDDPECFDDAGVGQLLDVAMKNGEIARVIIVVPQGDFGFWENWYDGTRQYEDWVVQDLMPYVQKRYHTRPCPTGCHVMGISMGGHGTLRFALHQPTVFASAAAISAPILNTDQMIEFGSSWFWRTFARVDRIFGPVDDRHRVEQNDLFLLWQEPSNLKGVRLMIAWAEDDRERIRLSNQALHEHLRAHGISHDALEFTGGHDWDAWPAAFVQALRFQTPLTRPAATESSVPSRP